MSYEVKETPTNLEKVDDDHIAITWGDGERIVYPMDLLRARCPCAGCVDEWTGQLLVQPEQVKGVRVRKMEQVGTYAFTIHFTDGHGTGIFTYKKLRMWGEHLKG